MKFDQVRGCRCSRMDANKLYGEFPNDFTKMEGVMSSGV